MNIVGFYFDRNLIDFCAWLGFIAFIALPLITGYIKIIGWMINKK